MSKRAPTPQAQPAEPPKIRPLNVDEALQFSPLASIIPFDASVIPLLEADVRVSESAFSSEEQQARAENQLQALNEEVSRSNGESLESNGTLRGMLELLKEKQETKP